MRRQDGGDKPRRSPPFESIHRTLDTDKPELLAGVSKWRKSAGQVIGLGLGNPLGGIVTPIRAKIRPGFVAEQKHAA